jgi:hypothetical protein
VGVVTRRGCPWFLGQERKENSKEGIFAGFLRKEEERIFAFRFVFWKNYCFAILLYKKYFFLLTNNAGKEMRRQKYGGDFFGRKMLICSWCAAQ